MARARYNPTSIGGTHSKRQSLSHEFNEQLEKKGYVCRREDPADRRNKLVFLTPEGDKFREQIRPILDEVYKEGERTIGLEQRTILLSGLKEMHDVLENI